MAYADRSTGGSRVVALVIVALINAVLGYAFVTGLAYQYIKKAQENLKTFEVEEPPPPPEEVPPPPPPPDQPMQPPPVVTPPPMVQTAAPPVFQMTTTPNPPPPYTPPPPAPPAPPPAPPVVNKAAGPKGNPADWITNDDYPPAAQRAEEQGTTGIRWTINTAGRVENCQVTSSSGSQALDRAACQAITRRGRYSPALDQAGNPIASSQSRRVVWKLPDR